MKLYYYEICDRSEAEITHNTTIYLIKINPKNFALKAIHTDYLKLIDSDPTSNSNKAYQIINFLTTLKTSKYKTLDFFLI